MTNLFTAIWSVLVRIDLRAWAAIAIFALTWRVIELVASVPGLLQDSSFMQLVTPICGAGGLLLIVSFLYGSNKEGADKTAALAENAKTLNAAGVPLRRKDDPVPVVAVDPAYAGMSDDELTAELLRRHEDPAAVARMDRTAMMNRLTEMDQAQ